MKNFILSIREIVILLIIQYVILIGIILIFGNDTGIVLGTLAIMFFEGGYVVYKWKKSDIRIDKNIYFPYILIGTGISVIYNMVIFKLGICYEISDISIVINILASCIIGPIFEEFLYRYSFINKLERYYSRTLVIFISSLVFALCHTGIPTIIFAFIIGTINAWFYCKTRDILIPIFIHISANMISTFLFGYNFLMLLLGIFLVIIGYFIVRE